MSGLVTVEEGKENLGPEVVNNLGAGWRKMEWWRRSGKKRKSGWERWVGLEYLKTHCVISLSGSTLPIPWSVKEGFHIIPALFTIKRD